MGRRGGRGRPGPRVLVRPVAVGGGLAAALGAAVLRQQYGTASLTGSALLAAVGVGVLLGVAGPTLAHAATARRPGRAGRRPHREAGFVRAGAGATAAAAAVAFAALAAAVRPAGAAVAGPCVATVDRAAAAEGAATRDDAVVVEPDGSVTVELRSLAAIGGARARVRYGGLELGVPARVESPAAGVARVSFSPGDVGWMGAGLYELAVAATVEGAGVCEARVVLRVDAAPLATTPGRAAAAVTTLGLGTLGGSTIGAARRARRHHGSAPASAGADAGRWGEAPGAASRLPGPAWASPAEPAPPGRGGGPAWARDPVASREAPAASPPAPVAPAPATVPFDPAGGGEPVVFVFEPRSKPLLAPRDGARDDGLGGAGDDGLGGAGDGRPATGGPVVAPRGPGGGPGFDGPDDEPPWWWSEADETDLPRWQPPRWADLDPTPGPQAPAGDDGTPGVDGDPAAAPAAHGDPTAARAAHGDPAAAPAARAGADPAEVEPATGVESLLAWYGPAAATGPGPAPARPGPRAPAAPELAPAGSAPAPPAPSPDAGPPTPTPMPPDLPAPVAARPGPSAPAPAPAPPALPDPPAPAPAPAPSALPDPPAPGRLRPDLPAPAVPAPAAGPAPGTGLDPPVRSARGRADGPAGQVPASAPGPPAEPAPATVDGAALARWTDPAAEPPVPDLDDRVRRTLEALRDVAGPGGAPGDIDPHAVRAAADEWIARIGRPPAILHEGARTRDAAPGDVAGLLLAPCAYASAVAARASGASAPGGADDPDAAVEEVRWPWA